MCGHFRKSFLIVLCLATCVAPQASVSGSESPPFCERLLSYLGFGHEPTADSSATLPVEQLARLRSEIIQSHSHWAQAKMETIIFNGEPYKVVNFLGGGFEGNVFHVQDLIHHHNYTIKIYHKVRTTLADPKLREVPKEYLLNSHADFVKASKFIPTIVDDQTAIDISTFSIRYRFIYGLTLKDLLESKLSKDIKQDIEDRALIWWRTYFSSEQISKPDNIVLDFETGEFYLIDFF